MTIYRWSLIASFLLVWGWAAIDPLYPDDWLLENYLVFIFVPVILVWGRYFRLSDLSYTLIAIFMMMHVIGSHYTYAETPFGYVLRDWFGSDRNMYDRFVHFCFGLLMAYPMREVFLRIAQTRGIWGYLLPMNLIIATATIYELIEWLVAGQVDITAGIAFLGAQGDIWDAQKDIAVAIVGTAIAMTIVAAINWRYKENYWQEIRESLRIPPSDHPLGEISFRELQRKYTERKNK
jgi:putative membrane protein